MLCQSGHLPVAVLALSLLGAVVGCDSTPKTPPLDQPIDRESAMEVDERMQKSSDALIKDRQDSAKPQ